MSQWSSTRTPSDLLLCLLAHYHRGFDVDDDDPAPVFAESTRLKVKESIKEVVERAFKQYAGLHERNHGIREANLKKLTLPIGIRKEDLDPTWVTNLDEFGKKRGDVAHKAVKAQQQIDPKAELEDVEKLVAGLEDLDALVAGLAL